MSEKYEQDPEPADDILHDLAPLGANDEFRTKLFQATSRVLRRRRVFRRAGVVAAGVVCYAAGLLTMSLTRSPNPAPEIVQATPDRILVPSEVADDASLSPLALEWQALDSVQKRPDLFRQAGDRYLAESGDMEAALRCYRNALDSGSEKDALIAPDDSWLLIALKQAKEKEKRDASLGS